MIVIKAVNVVIINQEKKVLIAKRKPSQPMPNRWEFPGGKLEIGETLEECGVREIKEELELDVKLDSYLGLQELIHEGKSFLLHFYTAHKIDEEQTLVLNEHSESKWIDMKDLDEYDLPAKAFSFIEKLQKLK